MGLLPDVELVVKHTFLEFVEHASSKESRVRAFTDTAMLGSFGPSPSAGSRGASAATGGTVCSSRAWPVSPLLEAQEAPLCHPAEDRAAPATDSSEQGVPTAPSGGSPRWAQEAAHVETRTTVMLRGLPQSCSRELLLELLNSRGFCCQYDFVYVPVNFGSGSSLGYAFVNLVTPAAALRMWACFDGFDQWAEPGSTACTLCWSSPHQGLAAHVERYMNSPVMHPLVPDAWRPALFMWGMPVAFPPPTKTIKAPKFPRFREAAAQ
eukprot:CAMPEP_0168374106 /NCGR_PEP_ID=MMETSP0228-20121227/9132_1 /TAXON_ID=133427 /ORGANISM="Protoceratium reticulatum, Strain CCCM 535 (=CCMP 1889)" /LENGTH=264 /DNA_ID=CAMNT_0008387047 /DNA_START=59 /DNA_END=853 /DNA_ORIENTATION=+